jgi:hypothetical protein
MTTAACRYRIERWRGTRFWAVMDGDQLVAVVVYLCGARSLVQRLTALGQ